MQRMVWTVSTGPRTPSARKRWLWNFDASFSSTASECARSCCLPPGEHKCFQNPYFEREHRRNRKTWQSHHLSRRSSERQCSCDADWWHWPLPAAWPCWSHTSCYFRESTGRTYTLGAPMSGTGLRVWELFSLLGFHWDHRWALESLHLHPWRSFRQKWRHIAQWAYSCPRDKNFRVSMPTGLSEGSGFTSQTDSSSVALCCLSSSWATAGRSPTEGSGQDPMATTVRSCQNQCQVDWDWTNLRWEHSMSTHHSLYSSWFSCLVWIRQRLPLPWHWTSSTACWVPGTNSEHWPQRTEPCIHVGWFRPPVDLHGWVVTTQHETQATTACRWTWLSRHVGFCSSWRAIYWLERPQTDLLWMGGTSSSIWTERRRIHWHFAHRRWSSRT